MTKTTRKKPRSHQPVKPDPVKETGSAATTHKLALGGFVVAVAGLTATLPNGAVDLWSKLKDLFSPLQARIVMASYQEPNFDLMAVRISNPTSKTQSLSEPGFACNERNNAVRQDGETVMMAWNVGIVQSPSPGFPPTKGFPIDVPAGSTMEVSFLLLKGPGQVGARRCSAISFNWLDAQQKSRTGEQFTVDPDTAMKAVYGPSQ